MDLLADTPAEAFVEHLAAASAAASGGHARGGACDQPPVPPASLRDEVLTRDRIEACIKGFDARIGALQDWVRSTLCENYSVYADSVAAVNQRAIDIDTLLASMAALEGQFADEDTGVRTRLLRSAKDLAEAKRRARVSDAILGATEYLARAYEGLNELESAIRGRAWQRAARSLLELEASLGEGAQAPLPRGSRISGVLAARVRDARSAAVAGMAQELGGLVGISSRPGCTDEGETLTLVVRCGDGGEDRLRRLFAAATAISATDDLIAVVERTVISGFAMRLIGVRTDVVQTEGKPEVDPAVSVTLGASATGPDEVSAAMVAILKFVLVHVFGPAAGDAGGARELMGRLGGRCAARLCQAIIRTHLYPAIPDTGHGLAAFYRELEEVRKFESRLADLGFLPSTKEEGEGQQQQQQQRDAQVEAMLGLAQLQLLSPDGRRPFTAFARDANMYYAIRRRDRAFSKMRELIEAGDFAEHVVGGDGTGKEGERLTEEWVLEALRRCVEDDKPVPKLLVAISSLATAAGQQPATVFPHCVVSQCAYEVAAHAYALLSEAFRLGGGAARTQLVLGAHALFDLFRVMRPAYHEAAFRKMPALAMTFFNDCLYLAHHSQLMAAVCEQLPPPRSGEAGARWTRTAVQLQHLAEVTLEAVLELEARTVIGLVPRLDGPSPGTEADCKRAALAVRQFASIIQPILTPHVCRKLVGQAIDRLLVHLADKVVAMENIGADESELISRRCRLFDGLDQLVTARPISSNDNGNAGDDDDDDELLAFYVPHRHKFRQLADILQMSMAEIMARYNSGLLSEFSKDQLQGLIRALFIDSEARQRNLAIIADPRV